jgi:hypothetical protein
VKYAVKDKKTFVAKDPALIRACWKSARRPHAKLNKISTADPEIIANSLPSMAFAIMVALNVIKNKFFIVIFISQLL